MPRTRGGPAFTAYFLGTWSCSMGAGSQVAKAYGASGMAADTLVLVNSYHNDGFVRTIREPYSQHGTTITDVSEIGPGNVFVGLSQGFAKDTLAFDGIATNSSGSGFERMTYVRIDDAHFTRSIESGASAAGPLATISSEACSRIAAASLPTAPPSPIRHDV